MSNRLTPEGKYITKEDYRFGFGIDSSHYTRVQKAREEYNKSGKGHLPTAKELYDTWDARTGCWITGEPFNTRYHELHDVILIDKDTNREYIVDCVMKQHYFGYYLVLLIREPNSQSHRTVYWENISCHDPIIKEGIDKNKFLIRQKVK